jgi:sugar/nucleoside kinase (ribokinase family)
MNKPRLFVLGDANVDLVIPLEDHSPGDPAPRESTLELHGGGTAANVAVGLSRLGEQVAFIGTVGDDGYGRWVMNDLDAEGIDRQHTRLVKDACTSMVLALINREGERSIYVWPDQDGAHTKLHPDAIRPEIFDEAAWLHTTGLCLREQPARSAQIKAMGLARQAGAKVSLDLNLRLESWGIDGQLRNVFDQAIGLSDFVFGSADEEIIPFTAGTTLLQGAETLSGGIRTVVARQGPGGVFVFGPGGSFGSSAFQVEVVDTLGAGDAFNAGFISAILAGEELRTAARWGNAAAALKITKRGARGLPNREELNEFLSAG